MATKRIPFAQASSVSLAMTSGFTASRANFDSAAFMNTLRVPVRVREIRVMVDTRPRAGAAVQADMAPFTYLEGKFGPHYITDGPVPISVLAPYKQQSDMIDVFPIDTGQDSVMTVRRIRLHKPLFVPPGRGFSFSASIPTQALVATYAVGVDVVVYAAVIGHYVDDGEPVPVVNDVPMISATQLTQAKRASLETELRNPLSKPLSVRHLVGAVPFRLTLGNILVNSTDGRGTTIDLRFPNADRAAEDPIDFMRVLFGQMRLWPARFDLPSNTRIRASISANTGEAANPLVGYQVALFGTRPEVIS